MTIPDYQSIMLPLLRAVRDGRDHTEGPIAEMLDALEACVYEHQPWVEYGIVEDRFSRAYPDYFEDVRQRYGPVYWGRWSVLITPRRPTLREDSAGFATWDDSPSWKAARRQVLGHTRGPSLTGPNPRPVLLRQLD